MHIYFKETCQHFFIRYYCVSPIGIFWCIANFINGELVGKITDVPWGVIFPAIDMSMVSFTII